ncbi:iron ABC transporter permease [Rhizobium sp. SEMIA 4085]|uniref:ABC transporter permease protein n=2 Tax=Rhizobium gallicum TaxID=56730 RepID=A0A0B4XCC0_9HYPH|nr:MULTISPECIES: iron ABC transporter permease [Rhizobium]AJD44410.1 ABC transporter permease protein [Rhizobium gallicum bv. gallicum R602sp]NNH33350.1 iron ABC transporter permease [Rhizobium sp. SEMIA 4085]
MSHVDLRPSPMLKAVRRRSGRVWLLASVLIAAPVATPVLALLWQALQGSNGLWPHLLAYVLPQAFLQTGMLLVGVGVLVTLLGTSTAWLVTAYDFPGRRLLEWALLLPLAMPTYIIAYAYLDLLHPIGWVQGAIRAALGYASPRDFRLPEIRSMAGCIVLLSFVLYPYVYLTTRAMFFTQAANLVEVSRTLGTGRGRVFWRVALPLARPAIAVGVSLALMEALNDIGASEFLGVKTLTVSVYTTWVTRSDLPGAAQIAVAMLLLVVALVTIERWARRRQRYWSSAQRARSFTPHRLGSVSGLAAFALGLIPVLIGFIAPASYLAVEAWKRFRFAGLSPRLLSETFNTVTLSAMATLAILLFGLVIAYAARSLPGRLTAALQRISTVGYAMPGTVLAIGILVPVAALDRMIDQTALAWLGMPTGLLLIGSGAALGYAYVTRFLAISVGSVEAGFSRIPRSFDHAARSLGQNVTGTFRHIHLPLSKPSLVAAGLLVFVDCMKELPATLLLRPLNFETLATHLYGEAARGTYEEASIAALAIVLVGTLPVIVLARIGRWKS